jgi:hypothetical protein
MLALFCPITQHLTVNNGIAMVVVRDHSTCVFTDHPIPHQTPPPVHTAYLGQGPEVFQDWIGVSVHKAVERLHKILTELHTVGEVLEALRDEDEAAAGVDRCDAVDKANAVRSNHAGAQVPGGGKVVGECESGRRNEHGTPCRRRVVVDGKRVVVKVREVVWWQGCERGNIRSEQYDDISEGETGLYE